MRAPTCSSGLALVWTSLLVACGVHAGTPICQCTGDVDGDGLVDSTDLGLLLGEWGECTLPCLPLCASDFTGDCVVDAQDLGVLLSSWGACVAEFPDPGPTIAQATDLGAVAAAPIQLCEYIGPGDADAYAFSLSAASTLTATITNRVDGIQAWLAADKNGNGVIDGADELEYVGSSGAGDLTIVEDLAAGDYVLLLSPWSSDYTNYSLTVSAAPIESLPEDPGSTMGTAHPLGTSAGSPLEVSDLIGGFDGTDYFRFDLLESRAVTVTLTDRTEGARLWLIADKNGNGVFDGVDEQEFNGTSGAGDLSIAEDLAAGTYFLQVQTWDSDDSTRYTLGLASTPLPSLPMDPGASILSALDLGTSGDLPIEVLDLIGGFDGADYFRFDLAESRAVTVTLTGRTEGARLWLIADKNGNGLFDGVDEQEFNGTSGSGDFSVAEDLAAGTYYLLVQTWDSDDSTRYTLRVTSTPLPSLPVDPGGSILSALELGTSEDLPIEVVDLIGGFDGADYFRFDLAESRAVTVTLTGRTEGARLWLIADKNGNGLFDGVDEQEFNGTSGSGDFSFVEDLAAGTYYLQVQTWDSDDSTRYMLRVTSTGLAALPLDPGSTLGTAHDLDVVDAGTPATAQELVGGYDDADIFRFEAGSTGVFTATLTGRTEGGRIWLLRDIDGDGIFDGSEELDFAGTSGSGNLAVSASLTAGLTYFLWIETWDSDDSTRYTLNVFVP